LLALGLGEGAEAQDRLREARNEIAWLRTKKGELDGGREELMTLFEDLDQLLNETRAGSRRQAEHLESAGTYVRQKESEVMDAHARMRELEAVIAEKDRHIGAVEGQLQEAGRYIRHKDQEYLDIEAELRKASEHVRTKELELREASEHVRTKELELREATARVDAKDREHLAVQAELDKAGAYMRSREQELLEAQTRGSTLDAATRGVAQVGLQALEAQRRLLQRALGPMLTRLHALHTPGTELRLPAPEASYVELITALGQARAGLDVLGDVVEWRRPMLGELEKLRAEAEWRRGQMKKLWSRPWVWLLRPGKLARMLARWRSGHGPGVDR
jgi:hypothetical protein